MPQENRGGLIHIGNSLSLVADTVIPPEISKDQQRFHMCRLSYICEICHKQVKGMTYHIHRLSKLKHTNGKGGKK